MTAAKKNVTVTVTNPCVEDLRKLLADVPEQYNGIRPRITVYRDRPFEQEEVTVSITYGVDL
jgi:hypothetical protein